jgi:hypothetical protein
LPLFTRGVGPFVHATAIAFVASAPVGAPFAMSTLGMLFVRAPPTPLNVAAPASGSKIPTGDTRAMPTGVVKCAPPSSERAIITRAYGAQTESSSQNAYTTPRLSVRSAQPCQISPCGDVPFQPFHVAPASRERKTAIVFVLKSPKYAAQM